VKLGLGLAGVELGLGDVGLGLGVTELGLGLGLAELGLGASGLGDWDEEVALALGEVSGECGPALWVRGSQPVSATMIADAAIAGQIRFGFTGKPPLSVRGPT
jgi:hypothetical protein